MPYLLADVVLRTKTLLMINPIWMTQYDESTMFKFFSEGSWTERIQTVKVNISYIESPTRSGLGWPEQAGTN